MPMESSYFHAKNRESTENVLIYHKDKFENVNGRKLKIV
jgi:hypothetical protein